VCRVEKDQVAGERGANADLRGLEVAGLTDEDHVGVLARKDRSRGGERAGRRPRSLTWLTPFRLYSTGSRRSLMFTSGRVDLVRFLSRAWWSCQIRSSAVISTMPYGW